MRERTSITAVIWDIDGTLVDSEPNHHRALLAVCQAYNVSIDDVGPERLVGVHMSAIWENILQERFPPSMNFDTWGRAINDEYIHSLTSVSVRPNAIQTIQRLHRLGIRQAAVSNSARSIVDANLSLLNGPGELEFSLSIDDVERGKPDPLPYKTACSRLGVDASASVAVEDSPSGLTSACAAGVGCIAYRTAEFPELGASHSCTVIENLADVVNLVLT